MSNDKAVFKYKHNYHNKDDRKDLLLEFNSSDFFIFVKHKAQIEEWLDNPGLTLIDGDCTHIQPFGFRVEQARKIIRSGNYIDKRNE